MSPEWFLRYFSLDQSKILTDIANPRTIILVWLKRRGGCRPIIHWAVEHLKDTGAAAQGVRQQTAHGLFSNEKRPGTLEGKGTPQRTKRRTT